MGEQTSEAGSLIHRRDPLSRRSREPCMVGLFGLADLARDLGQGAARHATGRPLSYRLALAGCFPETLALPQRCSNRSAVPVFAKDRGTLHRQAPERFLRLPREQLACQVFILEPSGERPERWVNPSASTRCLKGQTCRRAETRSRRRLHVLVEENAKPRSRQMRVPKKPAAESVKIYFA